MDCGAGSALAEIRRRDRGRISTVPTGSSAAQDGSDGQFVQQVAGGTGARAEAQRPQGADQHGHPGPIAAVGDLQGDAAAVGQRGAVHAVGAALDQQAVHRLHQAGVVDAGAADHVRVLPHGVGHQASGRTRTRGRQRAEAAGQPQQRGRVDRCAATVDADAGGHLAGGRLDHRADPLLQWMIDVEIARRRPGLDPAGGQHRRVLARAVHVRPAAARRRRE